MTTVNNIEGFTIATVKTEAMVKFYSNVFDIKFNEFEAYNSKLYSGKWGELKVLLCPAEVAGVETERNRHQFDISVANIEVILKNVLSNGGKTMGEVLTSGSTKSVGIMDPDGNTIVLKQYLS